MRSTAVSGRGGGRRSLVLSITVAVALTGCALTGPLGPATASPTNGPDPATIRYSCVGPPGFLPTLFDEQGAAEQEDHPSAAALRAFLAEDSFGLGFLPDDGWWLVERDAREAEYVARLAPERESPFGSVRMQANGADWAFVGGGDCRPEVLLEGQMAATWILPPNRPAPDRSTVEFIVLATDSGCTGGEPVGTRLLPPSITYTEHEVLIVFAARPRGEGGGTCQSKPPTEAVVRLREPLGDRRLVDAGVFPPVDPAAPGIP